MEDKKSGAGESVAATIVQRIDPACEQAYEAALAGFYTELKDFEGFLHREVIKSAAGGHHEYTIILHFDNEANLRRWEHSPRRLRWLSRTSSLAEHTAPLQVITGLETWFTLSAGQAIVPPPRHKMAVVTWLALFPLIALLSYAMDATIADKLPTVVHVLVTTLVAVPLMTYLVMPRMTRLFRGWLYARSPSGPTAQSASR